MDSLYGFVWLKGNDFEENMFRELYGLSIDNKRVKLKLDWLQDIEKFMQFKLNNYPLLYLGQKQDP